MTTTRFVKDPDSPVCASCKRIGGWDGRWTGRATLIHGEWFHDTVCHHCDGE